jgi:hypothetical protein
MRTPLIVATTCAGALLGAVVLQAEPMFLSRQYNRCTSCHYSATGGGLLTPYGHSLSRQELSTTGRSSDTGQTGQASRGEESFLFGALPSTGPLQLGIDLRPAHLHTDVGGLTASRDFFMTGDLMAAWRAHGLTVYGEVGREPRLTGTKYDSYEHWVGYESEKGLGVRVGRFLPAYGVQFADHTAYTRSPLRLDVYDQLYAVELSKTGEHDLLQLTVGPGRADSIIHDDGLRAFTASARYQHDLSSRTVLVVSGIYRAKSRLEQETGGGGLAFGIAPSSRLSIWSEADVQFRAGSIQASGGQQGSGAPSYVLLNETSLEIIRGLWLKVSPQLRTEYGDTSGGTWRLMGEVDFFPRTHWQLAVSYYRDESRVSNIVSKTLLAQIHLYL